MRQRLAGNKVELDLTRFPVVVLSEQGVLTDAERHGVLEALDEIVERRARHGLVLDMTRASALPESQRGFVADHSRDRAPEIMEKRAALAVVVRAPLLNHVPMAAYWMRISPVPAKVFTEVEQAVAWARAHAQRTNTGEIAAYVTPPHGMKIGSY
jgi:hypothetical protein